MNQLKTKIDEVKAKLGLTQMQLSERIGKNPYYLDTVKHRGVTTERQNELMLELELVANGGTVMTERELIGSLSEQLADAQERVAQYQKKHKEAQAANKELCQKLEIAEHEYKDLDEAYGRVCEKLAEINRQATSMQEYKRQYRNLVAIVIVIGIIVFWGLVIWSVV